VHEVPLLIRHNVEECHEVQKEPQKVLCPEEEDLHGDRRDFVKSPVLLRPSVLCASGVLESCNREEGSDEDVREEYQNVFQYPTGYVRPQRLSQVRSVVHGTKDDHQGKERVLVYELSGQYGFV